MADAMQPGVLVEALVGHGDSGLPSTLQGSARIAQGFPTMALFATATGEYRTAEAIEAPYAALAGRFDSM
jgi:hypothetical protein